MQTYFADLLAFFGISGAPQTLVTSKFCSENEKALFRGQRTKIKYG